MNYLAHCNTGDSGENCSMRGEFIGVWSETWREIWNPLASEETAPNDLYCELYRELAVALKKKQTPEELADIIDNADQAKATFEAIGAIDIEGERVLTAFFERMHEALDELTGYSLSNLYFN